MVNWLSRLFGVILTMLAAPGLATPGLADEARLTADEAHSRAQRRELLIIDVRTPAEWRQTGIPIGASTADITSAAGLSAFVTAVTAAAAGDRNRPIAVICRSGNRSTKAREVLLANGFTTVFNIKEGMAGSGFGPGWLNRGLPVTPCPAC
jgi:rhodanese-related sulfurtransferase